MDEQRIKDIILGKLAEHLAIYRNTDKTVADLVTFLTGLTVAKIKTAVVAKLNNEKAVSLARHTENVNTVDDLIATITGL